MKTIAIHQPNFFPYYPFFQKMEAVDLFVILSNCQFEKNNYQNRFNIGDDWFTMSVNSKTQNIINKTYVNPKRDWETLKNKLPQYKDVLEYFDGCIHDNLHLTNVAIIFKIATLLGIECEIEPDFETKKTKTDRLVEICQWYDGNKYLSGISGKTYLELYKFERYGIEVVFQEPSKMINKPIIEIIKERCLIKLL